MVVLLAVLTYTTVLFVLPDAYLLGVGIFGLKKGEFDLATFFYPKKPIETKIFAAGFRSCDLDMGFVSEGTQTELVSFPVSLYNTGDRNRERSLRYLKLAIAQGCSLDKPETASGVAPLHAAAAYNQPELVTFLLENGADISTRLQSDNITLNGMTALEFAKIMESIDGKVRSKIIMILSNPDQIKTG